MKKKEGREMNLRRLIACILMICVMLSGCAGSMDGSRTEENTADKTEETDLSGMEESPDGETDTSPQDGTEVFSGTEEPEWTNLFSTRDFEVGYDETKSIAIGLNGSSVTCQSDTVRISEKTVTITGEGTYLLSGRLDDGMIIVDAGKQDKIQLVLSDAVIHCENSAPIYILQADKVFITLADGSENRLSGGETFEAIDDNKIDGVIFSKEDLTLNGSGSLTVISPAGNGIVSKDSLKITGGNYEIESSSHALEGKDDVCIANASFCLTSGKDGIHAENGDDSSLGYVFVQNGNISISSEGDGISAASYMRIENGDIQITSGGGSVKGSGQTAGGTSSESAKGIKAEAGLMINGGTFNIDSADDAVHSNGSIEINGGTFEISSGDDGIHADNTLTVNGGTVRIAESYEGLEALQVKITGGDISLVARDDGLNAAAGGQNGSADGFPFGGGRPGADTGNQTPEINGKELTAEAGGQLPPEGGTERPDRGAAKPPAGKGDRPDTGTDNQFPSGGLFGGYGPMGQSGSSDASIEISGGTVDIHASGDGIDSNGTLTISGGKVTVCGPTQGDTSVIDYDASGVITGGTFIGTGASRMAQTFSDSDQGVITARMANCGAGTRVTLSDLSGKCLMDFCPDLSFDLIILSSPDLVKGNEYTLAVGNRSIEVTAE